MIVAEPGQEIGTLTVRFVRADLVRYAGASGDFNPIHWSDRKAAELGLAGVIAHGMLTMGRSLRVVTDWCADPARVAGYYVRFVRPVVVPDTEDGIDVTFTGTVTKVVDGIASVAIEALCQDAKVLGAAVAEVRLG